MMMVINSNFKIENVDRLSEDGNWCLIDELKRIYSKKIISTHDLKIIKQKIHTHCCHSTRSYKKNSSTK